MVGDPLKGASVRLAGKDRTIKFTNRALRVAQARLNGMAMVDVIPLDRLKAAAERKAAFDLGMNVTVELLAAGLLHEDPNSNDVTAEALLDADPAAYFPVCAAIITAWSEAARRMTPVGIAEAIAERKTTPGEGQAPPKPSDGGASADGPTSASTSSSAAGTGSTPS